MAGFTRALHSPISTERNGQPRLTPTNFLPRPYASTQPLDEFKNGKDELIPKSGEQDDAQRCWDVFDALAQDGAKYRREITVTKGAATLKAGDGAGRCVL